jgi:protein-S-isoprenylcysteine O-methyltransferase Ste14
MPRTRQPVSRAGAERVARARLIGGIMGMVLAVVVVFVALAFSGHPHRPGLAVVTCLILLVVLGGFNWWLYRLGQKQVRRMPEDDRSS